MLNCKPEGKFKTGRATVFGTKVLVHFSEDSYEYSAGTTQAELNQFARDEVLAKLNEISEVQSPYALALLEVL